MRSTTADTGSVRSAKYQPWMPAAFHWAAAMPSP